MQVFRPAWSDPRACLFLDRDGVVIEDRDYLADLAGIRVIPGIGELVNKARGLGMAIVLVTNQSGIARGYFGWAEFERVQAHLLDMLANVGATVDAVVACAYHPDGITAPYNVEHSWRKPGPGMLLAAAKELNLDMSASVLIGDKASDMKAARAAGLRRAIQVRTGHGREEWAESAALSEPEFAIFSVESVADVSSDLLKQPARSQESTAAKIEAKTDDKDLPGSLARLIEKLDQSERARVENLVAIFTRQERTVAGYPSLRPVDCRRVIDAFRSILGTQQEYFLRRDKEIMAPFWRIAKALESSAIGQYPTEKLALVLLMAEAHALAGDYRDARALIAPYVASYYSIEVDTDSLAELFRLDCFIGAATGDVDSFDETLTDSLVFVARLGGVRSAWRLFYIFAQYLAVGGRVSVRDGVCRAILKRAAQAMTHGRRRRGRRPMRLLMQVVRAPTRLVGACALAVLSRFGDFPIFPRGDRLASKTRSRKNEVLVTRAMGGIGDLMMMTPGLRVLAKRQGKPVKFAIKKQFFAPFENNPNVELIDIDAQGLVPTTYRRWYNLTACPAARYESRVAPFVKKGRVELFAKGMGVGERALRDSGTHLDLPLSEKQVTFRRDFIASHGLADQLIVGVQPFSRDSYKDHPQILDHIARLAKEHRVLVFHHLPLNLPASDNIVSTAGLALWQSLALVPACSVILSVDSAFLHVAAAFDVPVVAMFGPTDGKTFTQHHKRAEVLQMRDRFPCQPCWRNEDLPCQVTGLRGHSPCITAIEYATVERAITKRLAAAAG